MAPLVRGVTKPIATDHGIGVQRDAVADHATVINTRARIHDAIVAYLHALANICVGIDHATRAQRDASLNHRARVHSAPFANANSCMNGGAL